MPYPVTINQMEMAVKHGTPLQVEDRAYKEYDAGILSIEQAARRSIEYSVKWRITGIQDRMNQTRALRKLGVIL